VYISDFICNQQHYQFIIAWNCFLFKSFQQDANLAASAKKFLEDLIISSQLVPVEQKLAANIFKALTKVKIFILINFYNL